MELELTLQETRELKKYGAVEIERNGLDILVEKRAYEEGYEITIINPFEEVKLAKEPKKETSKTTFKKGHLYRCKSQIGEFIGCYHGREKGFECCICGKGGNAHSFAVPYREDTLENAIEDLHNGAFENYTFGTEHLPTIIEDLGSF